MMETRKVLVRDDNKAVICCPNCQTSRTVDIKRLKNRFGFTKARCSCGTVFRVAFELRRMPREDTFLEGYFGRAPEYDEWSKVLVRNISRLGIGFICHTTPKVDKGDSVRLTLASDRESGADIQRNATVRFVKDRYLGCEFAEPLPWNYMGVLLSATP